MERMLSDDVAPASIAPAGRDQGHDRNEQFIRLLTEHQSHLFVYLVSLLGDVHDASNVLQETNIVLWRRSAEFAEGTNFGAWSRTIAHFQLLAYFYSRRNLRPRCLARQVLACDFRAVSFRRTWYSTSAIARASLKCGSSSAASRSRTVRSNVNSGVFF